MKLLQYLFIVSLCVASLALPTACVATRQPSESSLHLQRAEETLDSLYRTYSAEGTCLLRENFPPDRTTSTTYLAVDEPTGASDRYSYLWPYTGTLAAVNALFGTTHNPEYKQMLDNRLLQGVDEYFDRRRTPDAYASYIKSAPVSDRYYDDNIWLGIEFTDLYTQTKDRKYLDKAQLIWRFVESGMDDRLGGGIYWCEQKKETKNACSNAPGAVLALKLFKATGDSAYFHTGQDLYEWTQQHLQDPADHLYFDHIRLDGKIGKAKYAYNSGQMMQAAALLHRLTGGQTYLREAQVIAEECYDYFFTDFVPRTGEPFRMMNKDTWFTAVMLRGFIELYRIDGNRIYIDAFDRNLAYAWEHARDERGLFNADISGKNEDEKKWLLTQAAMVEMYSRMATVD